MSHEQRNDENGRPPPENDDVVARLLQLAGPRPSVPTERAMRVKDAVQSKWRANIRARRRRRWGLLVMLPAAAALVVAFLLSPSPSVPSTSSISPLVARLRAIEGTGAEVQIPDSTRVSPLGIGGSVFAGTTVRTGTDGRAGFELTGGVSLRINQGTRVRLASSSELILEEGIVYIDNTTAGSVEVHTPFGVARDVGTQFEVRLSEESLRLRVREGTVVLSQAAGDESAGAGTEMTVRTNDSLQRRSIEVFGPDWDWVTSLAPAFEIEDSRLDGFLDWISRETGLRIHFESENLERSASDIVLHGTIEGLSLEEALETVLPTCGLTHQASEGKITIGELDAENVS